MESPSPSTPKSAGRHPVLWAWAVLVAGFWILTGLRLALAGLLPTVTDKCPSLSLLRTPCPFCGMTRAFEAFFSGQWKAAWGWSPLGAVILVLACLMTLALPVGIWQREALNRRVRLESLSPWLVRIGLLLLLLQFFYQARCNPLFQLD